MMNEATIANPRPLWTRSWHDPAWQSLYNRYTDAPSEIQQKVGKHKQPNSDDSNLFIEKCNTTAHSAVTADDDKIAVLVARLPPTLREHLELKKTLGTCPAVI